MWRRWGRPGHSCPEKEGRAEMRSAEFGMRSFRPARMGKAFGVPAAGSLDILRKRKRGLRGISPILLEFAEFASPSGFGPAAFEAWLLRGKTIGKASKITVKHGLTGPVKPGQTGNFTTRTAPCVHRCLNLECGGEAGCASANKVPGPPVSVSEPDVLISGSKAGMTGP